MAELSTLARPYAKAAFEYAQEHQSIANWEQTLSTASKVVADEDFINLLKNPSVTASAKSQILLDTLASISPTVNSNNIAAEPTFKNFIVQLAEQERIELLPYISEQFAVLRAKALKQVDAHITSAYPLTDTQRVLIKNRLEQSLNATVNLQESVDKSLLAGATIKIGDKLVDDSVRGKLKQLKTQLTA